MGKITLTVRTAGYSGAVSKYADVTTNDPQRSNFALSLRMIISAPGPASGSRVGPFIIGPSDHWSSRIPHGSSLDALITIDNDGPQPVRITKVIAGGEAFGINLETIQEGRRYLLTAKSAASLPIGNHSQVVKLATESREFPELQLQFEAIIVASVFADPKAISFEVSQENSQVATYTQSVLIRQARGAELEVKGVSTTLPLLKVKVETVNPNRVYRVKVGFNRKDVVKGDYQGTVKVETNSPDAPVIEIPVKISVQ